MKLIKLQGLNRDFTVQIFLTWAYIFYICYMEELSVQ